MNKLQQLKEKQAKELKVLEIEETILNNLNLDLKMFVSLKQDHLKDDKNTVFIDLMETKISEITPIIEKIVSVYPTKIKSRIIEHGGKKEHFSPFVLSTSSNIKSKDNIILNYYTKEHQFRFSLPIEFYSNDILGFKQRGVTDSEHHYFGGVSMSEIRKMRITYRLFDMFETLTYYGGSTTCFIGNIEDAEQYKFMAINGHVPEFLEFWKAEKENL